MAETLICVVASSAAVGVRETLRDWQSGGLVRDFMWIEAEDVDTGRPIGNEVRSGSLNPVDLRRLAGQVPYSRIRLAEIGLSDEPASLSTGEQRVVFGSDSAGVSVRRIIESSFGNSEISPLRILLTDAQGPKNLQPPQSVGWHYLVVSPEDTSSPGVGSAPIDSAGRTEQDIQRASQLAGLLGLWTGVEAAPLDAEETASYVRFRMARSFFRRLSGDSVELEVRNRLLAVDEGYPRPTHEAGRCIYVENPPAAARQAVSQLWFAHAHVLRSPRETRKSAQAKEIGMGEALRMLFSFLWASIIGAPAAWAAKAVRGVRTAVASSVQDFVFGVDQAAYQVVVAGQRSDGRPAGWQDLWTAAKEIERVLPNDGQTQHEDLSNLWREYTASALTLADGGVHGTVFRPIVVNSERAVMKNPADIVPDPADRYPALQGALGATLGSQDLDATDIVSIDDQGRRLNAESTRGAELSREAASELQSMKTWRDRISQTYSSQFGAELSKAIHEHRTELSALLQRMRDAASDGSSESAQLRKKQKRLGTIMRIIALVAVVLVVGLVILGATAVIGWGWAGSLIGAVLLGWFITAFVVFMRGQRELFRLINRRRDLESQSEVDRRNIAAVIKDLTRVTDAYSQYLHFTRALGHFIHQPFGRPRTSSDQEMGSFSDLPRSTAQGTISADESLVQEAALTLRHGQFQAGWMDTLWTMFMNQSAELLGPRGMELRDDPDLLYRVRGRGQDTLVHQWAEALDREGIPSTFGDALWESARQRLDTEAGLESIRARLTEQVASVHGTVSRERFLGSVGTRTSDPIGQSLLDATAIAADASRTQAEFVRTVELGLGSAVAHVQLTGPIESQSLGFQRSEADPLSLRDDVDSDKSTQPFGDVAF